MSLKRTTTSGIKNPSQYDEGCPGVHKRYRQSVLFQGPLVAWIVWTAPRIDSNVSSRNHNRLLQPSICVTTMMRSEPEKQGSRVGKLPLYNQKRWVGKGLLNFVDQTAKQRKDIEIIDYT